METKPAYKESGQRIKRIYKKTLDRKEAEKALRESEAQKKAILDASVDRIRLVDTDLRIIWTNKTTTRELAVDPEDLVGQTCHKIFFDKDVPCTQCPSKKAVTSGTIEHSIVHHPYSKDIEGETYWDNYSVPIKNESGDIFNLIQITRNITEQVRAEQSLHESEEKYRSLFEDSRDAVYITTREGKLIEANQSFLDLFGISREEIKSLNARKLYINPEERLIFQKNIEKKGSVREFSARLCKKDGTQMDCLLTSTVWRASDGKILGYQGIIRDITENKRNLQALRERENELKRKTINLKETNIALKVLLQKRDKDKTELEEKVLFNVKHLIWSYVEKLEKTGLNDRQKTYVGILEKNLNDIISPFLRTLSSPYLNISPAEIQVANFVKQGKTTKEIAELLNSSIRAIDFHRNSLRKKLGLRNKKTNLRSYLLSFK